MMRPWQRGNGLNKIRRGGDGVLLYKLNCTLFYDMYVFEML